MKWRLKIKKILLKFLHPVLLMEIIAKIAPGSE